MNLFIFFVSTVVTIASVVIVVKAASEIFFQIAKYSQTAFLFFQNNVRSGIKLFFNSIDEKWTNHCQRKEASKAKAQAEAKESAEELAKYKEIAEAKARSFSEVTKVLNPVFTQNRDWSEYDSPAFIRKGKAFVF